MDTCIYVTGPKGIPFPFHLRGHLGSLPDHTQVESSIYARFRDRGVVGPHWEIEILGNPLAWPRVELINLAGSRDGRWFIYCERILPDLYEATRFADLWCAAAFYAMTTGERFTPIQAQRDRDIDGAMSRLEKLGARIVSPKEMHSLMREASAEEHNAL